MRSTVLLAAAGAVVAMGVLEGVMDAAKPPPLTQATQATAPTKPTEATVKLYTAQCQACHGPNGKSPLKEMAFVERAWKHGTKTADMVKVITDGVPGKLHEKRSSRLANSVHSWPNAGPATARITKRMSGATRRMMTSR